MSNSGLIRAARLFYKGLSGRLSPANDIEYRELVRDALASADFYQNVRDFAAGWHCRVLDISLRHGIVVVPEPGSKLAMTAADFRSRLAEEDRGILALVLVTVAATFFPTAASLDFLEVESEVTATIPQIRNQLDQLCRRLEGLHKSDRAAVPPGLEESWRVVLKKPAIRESRESDGEKQKRATTGDLNGIVQIVVRALVDAGMLAEEQTSGEPDYLPLYRFRLQVRELAANGLYELATRLLNRAGESASGVTNVSH